ncbi:hypothetical protein [Paenibacillus campi]|nr:MULTISPECIES: hypothetical protein [unclassified Paenibacillus]
MPKEANQQQQNEQKQPTNKPAMTREQAMALSNKQFGNAYKRLAKA